MNKTSSSNRNSKKENSKQFLELKNTVTELKNSIASFKSRLDNAEEII